MTQVGKLSVGLAIFAIIVAGASIAQAYSHLSLLNDTASKLSEHESRVNNVSNQLASVTGQLSELSAKLTPKTQKFTVKLEEASMIEEVEGTETLVGEFHRWDPPVIVANKGDTVILDVKNPDHHAHSFILTAFEVDTGRLAGDTEKTVQFTASKAGVFEFRCGLPFDEEAGDCDLDHVYMVGYIVVLEVH